MKVKYKLDRAVLPFVALLACLHELISIALFCYLSDWSMLV